jgi:hypothetical protein
MLLVKEAVCAVEKMASHLQCVIPSALDAARCRCWCSACREGARDSLNVRRQRQRGHLIACCAVFGADSSLASSLVCFVWYLGKTGPSRKYA